MGGFWVAAAAVVVFGSGCVAEGRYEAAVQQGSADLAREQAVESGLRTKVTGLEEGLADLGHQLQDADVRIAAQTAEARAKDALLRRQQASAEARAALFRDLAGRLAKMVDAGDLKIVLRDGRMVLQLSNDILFDTGRTDIKPAGRAALEGVASVLKTVRGHEFQVAGHTDNVPIDSARYPSNWELSSARALVVLRLLVERGMTSPVLSAAGYAEFDPVASNDTAAGRARNRRTEITVQPNVDELVTPATLPE
jgi:chemotaxis protein MotB